MTAPVRPSEAACRVLHLITDLRTGGAEIQLARLVEGAAPAGSPPVEVVGVACLGGGGEIGARIARSGVPVRAFGARGPLGFLAASRGLGAMLRAERVDVVVAWLYHAMIATALPGVLPRGCRAVWNVRGTLPTARDKRGTRLAVQVARWLSGTPARIVYNSETARREHERAGYRAAGSLVLGNGYEVPAPRAPRPAGAAVRLTLIARYHPMKDFPTFLRAVALLRGRGRAVTAELVGEGCDGANAELAALIDALGLRECVVLTGAVSSTAAPLARADVVVSSSAWGEGFQNVLAEAALAGVPVVSTDVGEARAIVGDERFLAPADAPAALADAIERVLGLPDREAAEVVATRRDRLAARYGVGAMRAAYATLCDGVRRSTT